MSKFNPPSEFRFENPENWPEWKQRFHRYRLATKLNKEEGETQVSSLIYAMGDRAEKIFDSFQFDEAGHENNFDVVLKKFDEYFIVPRRNVILERACFYQRNQQRSNGETADMYIRALIELAEHCEFGDKRDEHIRDRLVVGIANKELSREFQLKTDLTLANVIERVCQTEAKDVSPTSNNPTPSYYLAPSSSSDAPVSTTPMSPPPTELEQLGTSLPADNPGGAENGEEPNALARLPTSGAIKDSKRRPIRSNPTASTSIPSLINMGAQGNQSTEDLIKQLRFSRNINQLLGSLQQTQNPPGVKQGLLGHGPRINMGMQMSGNGGYPSNHPPGAPWPQHNQGLLGHGPGMNNMNMQNQMSMNRGYPPGAPQHFNQPPHNQGLLGHGPGINHMNAGDMRGGPHWGGRGGGFHGDPWRGGGEQSSRGRGRGPRRDLGNTQERSKRTVCRHFVDKGTCGYGNVCIFYHPGVDGPPLPFNQRV